MVKDNKVFVIEAHSAHELEDALNTFYATHDVIATQIFNSPGESHLWTAFTYYRIQMDMGMEKPQDNVLATEKQVKFLKDHGFQGAFDTLTKKEAHKVIAEMVKKK